MRVNLFFLILFLLFQSVFAQKIKNIYDAPDQIIWHEGSKSWYVSSLGGGVSFAKDGYGWITKLDYTGKIIDSLWVKGLDAPSGMAAAGDKLYVCDRQGVLEIDIRTAIITHIYPLPGAEFINDIAIAGNGDIYVSDFFGDKIYRLPSVSRRAEKFLDVSDSPDGLYVDGNSLIIVTWGKLTDRKTFATSRLGNVLSVNIETKVIKPFLNGVSEVGNLEGVTKVGRYFYVTDWVAGKLLRISKQDGVEEILSGLKNPTDLDYSPSLGRLGFPEHGDNRVFFLFLGKTTGL